MSDGAKIVIAGIMAYTIYIESQESVRTPHFIAAIAILASL